MKTELKDELLWRAFTQYPNFHKGLEIECGTGRRIRVGRKRGHNIHGVNSSNLKGAWVTYCIDTYIKVGKLPGLPYPDMSFDYVTCPYPLKIYDWGTALKEIWRVGSRSFYMSLPMTVCIGSYKDNMECYVKMLLDAKFRIEVIQISMDGHLIVEAAKG